MKRKFLLFAAVLILAGFAAPASEGMPIPVKDPHMICNIIWAGIVPIGISCIPD